MKAITDSYNKTCNILYYIVMYGRVNKGITKYDSWSVIVSILLRKKDHRTKIWKQCKIIFTYYKRVALIATTQVFSSVPLLSRVWLCNPMDCSTPGFPVHHQLPELAQTQVHPFGDAIQPSHPVVPFSFCLRSFPAWVFSNTQVLEKCIFWLSDVQTLSCHSLPPNISPF